MAIDKDKQEEYGNLWVCFKTQQMNTAQLREHCAQDEGFKAFVDAKLSQA